MTMSSLRVLVVDAPPQSGGPAERVARALDAAGFTVRITVPGEPAGDAAARFRPDVAVVCDGAAEAGTVRQELEGDFGVPVLVVADGTIDVRDPAGLTDGAHPAASPATLAAGDLVVDLGGRIALRAEEPLPLTQREFELLAFLVRNRNRVCTREALLAAVWHNEPVTPNAIEALVSKLRAKLERRGPRVVHTVRGIGYVLRVEGTSPFDVRRQASVGGHREARYRPWS